MRWEANRLRETLANARVMLIFTPELTGERDALTILESILPWVDMIQVRPKPVGAADGGPTEARAARDWCRAVLERVATCERPLPVLVNDRVDVAHLLADEGLAGVHLGQTDCPWQEAREQLGPDLLIGLSTHDVTQVAQALDAKVDYLGFGPVFPTATKGFERGVSPETTWVASQASEVPLFPIGGISPANAQELSHIGRAAVGSALLASEDPAGAARAVRGLLER
ncbi:MAG: thiamine-phosphate pyrophosphorylase [Chlamydiales bacterium]|jgi:thiamine-phosphate pyrophosphorylase